MITGPLRTTELNIVELDTYGNYRDRTLPVHNTKNILYKIFLDSHPLPSHFLPLNSQFSIFNQFIFKI
jgi:hypothetical protein